MSEAAGLLAGRRKAPLATVADEIAALGRRAAIHAGDVTLRETCRFAVAACLRVLGGLDLAFNNAGGHGNAAPIDPRSMRRKRTTTSRSASTRRKAASFEPCRFRTWRWRS